MLGYGWDETRYIFIGIKCEDLNKIESTEMTGVVANQNGEVFVGGWCQAMWVEMKESEVRIDNEGWNQISWDEMFWGWFLISITVFNLCYFLLLHWLLIKNKTNKWLDRKGVIGWDSMVSTGWDRLK